jgi:ABC-type transport system involved in cytochrome bd biosynthesis fused ATPase/permease subunit
VLHPQLLRVAREAWGGIAVLAAVGLLLAVLHVAFAIGAGAAVGAVVRGTVQDGASQAVAALAVLAALATARAVVTWAQEPLAARRRRRVRARLRARLLTRLPAVPPRA